MGKRLAIGLLLIVGGSLGGCARAISTEGFGILENQITGILILDGAEGISRNVICGEGNIFDNSDFLPRGTVQADSIIKAKIKEGVSLQGYSTTAFYEKAKELNVDAVEEIRLAVNDANSTITTELMGGILVLALANPECSEDELCRMLEGFMWMKVDTLCREKGYLPSNYEKRMKQYHWPGGKHYED